MMRVGGKRKRSERKRAHSVIVIRCPSGNSATPSADPWAHLNTVPPQWGLGKTPLWDPMGPYGTRLDPMTLVQPPTPQGVPVPAAFTLPGGANANRPARATRLAHPDDNHWARVTDVVSTGRFTTYLRYAGGADLRAWAAYAWNVRVSAELLQVFCHAEIALRNAVDGALSAAFGASWPYANAFVYTFGVSDQQEFLTARGKLERRLGVAPMTTGDFVAGQTLAFWNSLLVTRYRARVWNTQFRHAFPGAVNGETYKTVRDAAEALRLLRNRIAHHEPLLTVNVGAAYANALQVVRWVSPEAADWILAEWPRSHDLIGPP